MVQGDGEEKKNKEAVEEKGLPAEIEWQESKKQSLQTDVSFTVHMWQP